MKMIMEQDPFKEVNDIKEDTLSFDYLFTEEDIFQIIDCFQSIIYFAKAFNIEACEIIE